MSTKKSENHLAGVAASPGIAFGNVLCIGGDAAEVVKAPISAAQVSVEIEKLEIALSKSKVDLQETYEKTLNSFGVEAA